MAKARIDDIDLEAIQAAEMEAALPKQFYYVTWYDSEYTHISQDRRSSVCGVETPIPDDLLISKVPMGKPRCRACLEAAGIEPREKEPEPFRGHEEESKRERPKVEPLPKREAVQPKLPPEFFSAKKAPEDAAEIP